MMMVAPISTRNQFGQLLADKGLTNSAVEVGTHRGEFAEVLLSCWPGSLFCVDPWDLCSEDYNASQARFLWGGGDRRLDLADACARLGKFNEGGESRMSFMKLASEQAVRHFAPGSLDFVYLDGDHRRQAVEHDLRAWWPKLKLGGLLAGHDFVCPGPKAEDNWGGEIQPAVLEFAQLEGRDVFLVVEEGGLPWSFYLEK